MKKLPKQYKGPFYGVGHMGQVFMKTKQGDMTVLDVRGWGYLTGKGSLGLEDEEAAQIQDRFEDWVIEAMNEKLEREQTP